MKDLIAVLEAAPEGSQELDARVIAAVVGAEHVEHPKFNLQWHLHRMEIGPTRSLDAALLLLPPGWHVAIGNLDPIDTRFTATICRGGEMWHGYSKHAPLAMCIAALKAREAA